jgi:hypothetical protein
MPQVEESALATGWPLLWPPSLSHYHCRDAETNPPVERHTATRYFCFCEWFGLYSRLEFFSHVRVRVHVKGAYDSINIDKEEEGLKLGDLSLLGKSGSVRDSNLTSE